MARCHGQSRGTALAIRAPRGSSRGYVTADEQQEGERRSDAAESSALRGQPRRNVAADKQQGGGSAARRCRRGRGTPEDIAADERRGAQPAVADDATGRPQGEMAADVAAAPQLGKDDQQG